jgi:hypothetical protein
LGFGHDAHGFVHIIFAEAGDAMAAPVPARIAASNLTKMYSECGGAPARTAHHILNSRSGINRVCPRTHEETAMSGKKVFVAFVAAALGVLSTTAAWSNFDGRHNKADL